MKLDKKNLRLYAITDRAWLGGASLAEAVEEALKGGATLVQYREKHLTGEALMREAREVQGVCRRYQVPFIVNDHVDLALALDADGVHVGQSDMAAGEVRALLAEGKMLGVSARTLEEAKLAEEAGADYLGVGAVFPTETKDDANLTDLANLARICREVSIPVVAIGGISRDRLGELKGSGIAGVAVVSAVFAQGDIEGATRALDEGLDQVLEED